MDIVISMELWRLLGIGGAIALGAFGAGVLIGKPIGWREGAEFASPPHMRNLYRKK
jgi:hypothetical protein